MINFDSPETTKQPSIASDDKLSEVEDVWKGWG